MAKEIERKFLVKLENGNLPKEITEAPCKLIMQGYLSLDINRQVRIRTEKELVSYDTRKTPDWAVVAAFLTIKGASKGISTDEFEYDLDWKDALELMKLCTGHLITKIRSDVGRWEVDTFLGDNEGLFVAEIELTDINEYVELPYWVGKEVSTGHQYKNVSLAVNPWKSIKEKDI